MTPLRLSFLPLAVMTLVTTGCPHPRYMVADVTTTESSIRDALVATDCGGRVTSARRTNERGRAIVTMFGSVDVEKCIVTVAKPGYETVEASGVNLCSKKSGCPPTRYILRRLGGVR